MHSATPEDKKSPSERRRLSEVARIKSLLIVAGITLTQIDKSFGLPAGTAGNAVHQPHVAGERAIAAALGTRPELLWRTRYHADGRRKSPQPAEHYRQGRKAASTTMQEAA